MKTLRKLGNIEFPVLRQQLENALGAAGTPQKWYFNGATGEVTVYFDESILDASVQAVLDAHDPTAPAAQDVRAAMNVDGVDRLQFRMLFNHENMVRDTRSKINALAVAVGQPAPFTASQAAQVTAAQFRQGVIDLWKQLNP